MRYLSLFSGIEAATVAWHPLGWECVGVSEIEPFPCAVLAHHYPNVPNLGDVTKITERDIAALGQIDLVVFGSPCQDLSVAGKRRGLAGERSGLFHTAIDIIEWARKHCGCRWALWENVPGAFSSNNGRDFATVVELLAGLDSADVPPKGWGFEGCALGAEAMVEWAVLDAQWFGVAQRRRRVFALADFGDWAGRPPILLEPEGLRGGSAPSREARKTIAGSIAGGAGTSGTESGHIRSSLAYRMQAFGEYADDETASCMKARDYKDATDLAVTYPIDAIGMGRHGEFDDIRRGLGVGSETDPQFTLKAGTPHAVAYGFNSNAMPDQMRFTAELSETLTCSQYSAITQYGETAGTLTARHDSSPCHDRGQNMVAQPGMQVRRLTPVECERLQGFPDGYTQITWRNKPASECPDGPRYKALGNSMAVPVMRWIGQGIDAVALFQ